MRKDEAIEKIMGEFAAIDKCSTRQQQERSEAAEVIIREALTRMFASIWLER